MCPTNLRRPATAMLVLLLHPSIQVLATKMAQAPNHQRQRRLFCLFLCQSLLLLCCVRAYPATPCTMFEFLCVWMSVLCQCVCAINYSPGYVNCLLVKSVYSLYFSIFLALIFAKYSLSKRFSHSSAYGVGLEVYYTTTVGSFIYSRYRLLKIVVKVSYYLKR